MLALEASLVKDGLKRSSVCEVEEEEGVASRKDKEFEEDEVEEVVVVVGVDEEVGQVSEAPMT